LFLLKLLPYVVIWVLFTFIYIFMPNTKVKFRSGLVAGVAAGTLFQLAQWVYVTFQIGAAKYGAIYGSFAALPLFLIWLQLSWLIVLFGAEISFAHQNVHTYEFEQDSHSVSHSFKMLLSLAIAHRVVKDFCSGEKPADATQISEALDIPIRLVRQILFELSEARILSEIHRDEDQTVCYQPARDVAGLTVGDVVNALQNHGSCAIPVIESEEFTRLRNTLNDFDALTLKSSVNISLKDI
jgi:membrane protein